MTRDKRTAELEAGRVGRPHGLDGSFYVTHPRPRLLTLGTTVTLAGRAVEIVRRAGNDTRPILRVHGIDDRASAEALRGQPLTVASLDAPPLPKDEWWAHELEGCAIVDGDRRIGVVTRLIELPSCEVLEVHRDPPASADLTGTHQLKAPPDAQPQLLVPMVKDAIRNVDVQTGVIDVDMRFIED